MCSRPAAATISALQPTSRTAAVLRIGRPAHQAHRAVRAAAAAAARRSPPKNSRTASASHVPDRPGAAGTTPPPPIRIGQPEQQQAGAVAAVLRIDLLGGGRLPADAAGDPADAVRQAHPQRAGTTAHRGPDAGPAPRRAGTGGTSGRRHRSAAGRRRRTAPARRRSTARHGLTVAARGSLPGKAHRTGRPRRRVEEDRRGQRLYPRRSWTCGWHESGARARMGNHNSKMRAQESRRVHTLSMRPHRLDDGQTSTHRTIIGRRR